MLHQDRKKCRRRRRYKTRSAQRKLAAAAGQNVQRIDKTARDVEQKKIDEAEDDKFFTNMGRNIRQYKAPTGKCRRPSVMGPLGNGLDAGASWTTSELRS